MYICMYGTNDRYCTTSVARTEDVAGQLGVLQMEFKLGPSVTESCYV